MCANSTHCKRTSSSSCIHGLPKSKLSGKLAAVMPVAVIPQDCLARHTAIVLAKPSASILSPNMMRMLDMIDMIMRMKVIVWRKRGARENGN